MTASDGGFLAFTAVAQVANPNQGKAHGRKDQAEARAEG
jgi:hypothetical protein